MNKRETAKPALDRALTIEELLADEVLSGAELVAGRVNADRVISAVNVMTVPDIGRWVRSEEFLLATGYPLPCNDQDRVALIRELHDRGVAGIGIKLNHHMPELSPTFVAAAEEVGMPLIVIPERIRFDDILSRSFAIITNRQASALARAHEIHSSLLEITLSGGGLWKLARKLSTLLGQAGVVIVDSEGSVLAKAQDLSPLKDLGLLERDTIDVSRLREPSVSPGETSGRGWAARQIRAGNLRHGFVVAFENGATFGDFSLVALDQAAVVAALEITRDLAVGAVERRFSSNALFELITGGESEFADAAAKSAVFGWNLDRDVVVLVGRKEIDHHNPSVSKSEAHLTDERTIQFWSSAVRSRDASAAAASLGVELVAVMGDGAETLAAARAIRTEVAQFTRSRFAVGVSRAYRGSQNIAIAYQEAKSALRLGHRVSGPEAVTEYAGLGMYRLLAQIEDDELHAFAEETLRPLLGLNEPDRSEMLSTLQALTRHNMNMAKTARDLHYHYNTMRYRLSKLERLLGPFSTDTEMTVRVYVALQIMDMPNYPGPVTT